MKKPYSAYSTLFHTIYDEQQPVGYLGRGAHYSVIRAVQWRDSAGTQLAKPSLQDIAIVWDEDHDIRVIEVVGKFYLENILWPVLFVGERKGNLSVIMDSAIVNKSPHQAKQIEEQMASIVDDLESDCWGCDVSFFDTATQTFDAPMEIIQDSDERVGVYLKNIYSLWCLGTHDPKALLRFYAQQE